MVTYTPINMLMDMPIVRFWEFNNAAVAVLKARKEARG